MNLTIWAEMSGKGARASMTVEVPDDEVRTPDGDIDEEKAEAVAREYLGNLVEWGWTSGVQRHALNPDIGFQQ